MPIEWPKGKRPVFVGSGSTMCRRYFDGTKSHRANEAALMAIEDAGLSVDDIDGIYIWADPNWGPNQRGDIKVWLDVPHMMSVVNWNNIKHWIQTDSPAAGSCAGPQLAAMALGAGVCNYALVIRTGHHPAGVRYRQVSGRMASGAASMTTVYGHGVGGSGQAITYQRYLSKYGAKREEMAGYVLNAHRNAQLNPYAVWNGRQITYDDYVNSRLIAYPMCVFDNDMPVDGVQAVVMTTEDRAKDTPHPGGYISGIAAIPMHRSRGGVTDSLEGLEEMNDWQAKNLYDSAGVRPEDIDLKHVYDGFSPMVWMWLEAFGFAPRGEAHLWCQPENIALEGPHPLNTAGGNLGNGRIHGMTNVWETANQMMGTAGPRQLPMAGGELKKLDVALCETGPFGSASSFICTRE